MRAALFAVLLLCGLPVPAQQAVEPFQLAITFDDLPVHGPLPPGETRLDIARSILATLQAQPMPPVYGFVNARRLLSASAGHVSTSTHDVAPTDPEYAFLQAWRAAGKPLGNHTANHLSLDEHSEEAFEANIRADEPTLKTLMSGQDWHWFRFPYLQEGDTLAKQQSVHAWLLAHGYRVADVSMDFEDYLWNAPYARCVAQHDQRSIATLKRLFLETAGNSMNFYRLRSFQVYGREIPYILLLHVGAFEAVMLPDLLTLYHRAGVQFVSLQQAEADPAYAEPLNLGVAGGGTWLDVQAHKRGLPHTFRSMPYQQLEQLCPVLTP